MRRNVSNDPSISSYTRIYTFTILCYLLFVHRFILPSENIFYGDCSFQPLYFFNIR